MKNLHAYLFGIASLAFFVLIGLYIFVYQPASGDWQDKLDHMNRNWSLISSIWRGEFLVATVLSWVAFYFSKNNSWWLLVGIGHLLMLVEYALMLGGYPEITTEVNFNLIQHIVVWIFAASNFIWLIGMTGVYYGERGWIRYVGGIFALVCGLLFLTIVFGLFRMEELLIVGPLLNLLYLVNAYYGFRHLTVRKIS